MTETATGVRETVRKRFGMIASSPDDERKFPLGAENAKVLGYDAAEIDALPRSVTESFAGVTNVLLLGEIRPGQTVIDLGCGAGLDCLLAAQRVSPSGKVIGVDMTTEMIDKARRSARELSVSNVEFLLRDIEDLMLNDGIADVVISNGVFNLCPDKPRALAETCRVLRPGGRFQMADVFLDETVQPKDVAQMGDWCEWVAGAVSERSFLEMLSEAGFVEAKITGRTDYSTSEFTNGATVTARKSEVM